MLLRKEGGKEATKKYTMGEVDGEIEKRYTGKPFATR